jgi:DNA repair exonuclease SbcCD ATPase subunit
MESVMTTTYEIRNKGADTRTLIVEHPRVNNRTLRDAKPFETTDGFYRFRVALNPSQATTLPVSEVLARQTRVMLTDLTREQLTLFAGRETPQAVREKLGQIVEAQEQVASLTTDAQSTQAGIDRLYRDQERLRENFKALGTGAQAQPLRTRYLDQLKSQEDQIQTMQTRIDAINKEIATARARLADVIATFAFGG